MAEQWPFKPLVERSSRSTLTDCLANFGLASPQGGRVFELLHAHKEALEIKASFCLVAVPIGGSIFEPLHAHFLFKSQVG